MYRFATYTGAKIRKKEVTEKTVNVQITWSNFVLDIVAERAKGGVLLAPTTEDMVGRIAEALTAKTQIRLAEGDDVIIDELGRNSGLEVGGAYAQQVEATLPENEGA